MRSHFADWAAHNSAKMDYLSAEQYERGLLEISLAGDWDYFRPSVWANTDQGTQGDWVRPSQELTTRGWAYNVWNITNTGEATYRSVQWLNISQYSVSQSNTISSFELEGDSEGSQGATSHFEGRVVVMGAENNFYTMEMSSPLSGSVEVEGFGTDYQVMLVVASVPEFFGSYQTYGYQVKITKY